MKFVHFKGNSIFLSGLHSEKAFHLTVTSGKIVP